MENSSHQESLFAAIADFQRRKILNLLKQRELSVAEMKSHFDISGATLSHHLNMLKAADLVRVRRKGQQRIYTLNLSVAEELLISIKQLFDRGYDDENY